MSFASEKTVYGLFSNVITTCARDARNLAFCDEHGVCVPHEQYPNVAKHLQDLAGSYHKGTNNSTDCVGNPGRKNTLPPSLSKHLKVLTVRKGRIRFPFRQHR